MAYPKTIHQPHTSIWLAKNGMINIEQEADPVYSDVPSVVTIDPLFVPVFVSWLLELASTEAVG